MTSTDTTSASGSTSPPEPASAPDPASDSASASAEEFWDGRYSESDRIWSGKPNAALVQEAADLTPGSALDLGCGEGADALWLAREGWRVTAADVSGVALGRAREHAEREGLAARIDFQRHDFARSIPDGAYDLVSAHFLHSPGDMPREDILRRAAAAVAPGGILLIVGHQESDSWESPHPEMHLPTTSEVLASLDLPDGAWDVLVSEAYDQHLTDADGNSVVRTNNTLKLRRR